MQQCVWQMKFRNVDNIKENILGPTVGSSKMDYWLKCQPKWQNCVQNVFRTSNNTALDKK